jgi:hypothetical protein
MQQGHVITVPLWSVVVTKLYSYSHMYIRRTVNIRANTYGYVHGMLTRNYAGTSGDYKLDS